MRKNQNGFSLIMVMAIIAVMGILLPFVVSMISLNTKQAQKHFQATLAYNLAEAGIEKAQYMLKSSTTNFAAILAGTIPASYNFGTTFNDIPGGYYRIRITPGPATNEVTVLSEGKDSTSGEVRAIRVVFENSTFPAALIAEGDITMGNLFQVHWGPVMAHGDIKITGTQSREYFFPRKLAKRVVTGPNANPDYDRDENGLVPPNTDGAEWWSGYKVPSLPILDWDALRASAIASGTYNVWGCSDPSNPPRANGVAVTQWWTGNEIATAVTDTANSHANHFMNSNDHPESRNNRVWFWDGNVDFTGVSLALGALGLNGTVIVNGNMSNVRGVGDQMVYLANVPPKAWKEYKKIGKDTGDLPRTNQYPADAGFEMVNSTFSLGMSSAASVEAWDPPDGLPSPNTRNTDVAFHGLVYVRGNLTIRTEVDFHGVIWVKGNVFENSGGNSDGCLVFYDDTITLPTLNIVLVQNEWDAVRPSPDPWAAP